MQSTLQELLAGRPLGQAGAERAFELILTGQANEMQVAAMLALLAARGVELDELVGAARVMRRHVTPVPTRDSAERPLLDTCGTGGAPKTFNISTAAAVVAASVRGSGPVQSIRVAKHGGRSRTGRGAAEVLALLGVNVDASPELQAKCLDDVGVCFSFAVNHHPAMRFAVGPRKSLGFPTIFNLLGPLTNPAGARRQLMGVWDGRYAEIVAKALGQLGAERAMVVHGMDALDEMTTCDQTFIAELSVGSAGPAVHTRLFDPLSVGVARARHADLVADSAEDAAGMIRAVLGLCEDHRAAPARDIVSLNAAAALVVGGVARTFAEGVELSRAAIAGGAAARTLQSLASRSKG